MPNGMQDVAKEVKDGARETMKAASNASGDVQADMKSLRDDVTRLTSQLAEIASTRGSSAWNMAKANVEGAVSDVQDKGMEAMGAVREVGDHVVEAIDQSLKSRPYTTLALAVGIGFLFGATWRR